MALSELASVRSLASDLREEHRQLDQILALLAAAPVDLRALRRVVSELEAHIDAEAALLHPLLEPAMLRPLRVLQGLHSRMHRAASRLCAAADHDAVRAGVRELRLVFREHAAFQERVALPALETLVRAPALDAFGSRVRAARTNAGRRTMPE